MTAFWQFSDMKEYDDDDDDDERMHQQRWF